jgi:hypothetical protein
MSTSLEIDKEAGKHSAYTNGEYDALVKACQNVPPAKCDYRIHDFVENMLLTVLDFQLRTVVVERAMQYFIQHTKSDALDHSGLKVIIAQYTDDKTGNSTLARRLWGYNLWTRAEMLRKLVAFFEAEGVTDQHSLEVWAEAAQFKSHFQGKVKGLSYAVFKWLTMRLGVDTVKPDVHVLRFVEKSIGRPINEVVAVEMIERAAKQIGIEAHKLDWAIWEARQN